MNASEFDRAFGLAPDDVELAAERARILDGLSVLEHGILFRHVPAGEFLMGSDQGDPDERPVHSVHVGAFWMSETTVSWDEFARLSGLSAPPGAEPLESTLRTRTRLERFYLQQALKIRLQYCEDETLHARDWHAHIPSAEPGGNSPLAALFGQPERSEAGEYRYSQKPMVAVSWRDAHEFCERLSTPTVRYRLPTEAEWEKAARGGLIGRRYAWGDSPPTRDCCDFNRFEEFSILPCRAHPPNGYGLFAMCGSVWEWTSDLYDALAYPGSVLPPGPGTTPPNRDDHGAESRPRSHVLRGGSWSDGPDAVTVSFRMSLAGITRGSLDWDSACLLPNVGFRICRELV